MYTVQDNTANLAPIFPWSGHLFEGVTHNTDSSLL